MLGFIVEYLRERILFYDSRLHLFPRKPRSRWTKPFVFVKVFSHVAIKIRDRTKDQTFTVNRHRLKHFLQMLSEGDVECHVRHEPPRA